MLAVIYKNCYVRESTYEINIKFINESMIQKHSKIHTDNFRMKAVITQTLMPETLTEIHAVVTLS